MQIGHMTPTSRLIKSQKRGKKEAETEKQQSEEQNYNTKLILNRGKHTHTHRDSEHNWLKNAGPQ